MPTINIDADANIKDVTYAAGDSLVIRSLTSAQRVLTIDAQVAADVAKIEGTKPLSFGFIGLSKLRLINNSTTQPLIVSLSAFAGWISGTTGQVFETRGALMSIGTGTGAVNQEIDLNGFPSSNGALLGV